MRRARDQLRRLLDDVRSIAESRTALPRLIDELVVLWRQMETPDLAEV